jgi:hypothetical protein
VKKNKEPSPADYRPDFEQALGEEFGEAVSPPVPFEDASPHECREVVCEVLGDNVTPTRLAAATDAEIAEIARLFGEFGVCKAPTARKIKSAIAQTLARWPVGSLGE